MWIQFKWDEEMDRCAHSRGLETETLVVRSGCCLLVVRISTCLYHLRDGVLLVAYSTVWLTTGGRLLSPLRRPLYCTLIPSEGVDSKTLLDCLVNDGGRLLGPLKPSLYSDPCKPPDTAEQEPTQPSDKRPGRHLHACFRTNMKVWQRTNATSRRIYGEVS